MAVENMKNTFTIKQIEDFKKLFLNKKREILCSYQDKKKNDEKNNLDVDGDEVDLVQGNLLSAIIEKLSIRESQKLQKIENALIKINAGTFGICEGCEEIIAKNRLLAYPETELCIFCAEQAEKEEKLFIKKNK
jgi:DnaK suppressor protein